MKILFSILLTACILFSCKSNENKTTENSDANVRAVEVRDVDLSKRDPIGSFSGAFGDTKITILLTGYRGDTVLGRSIVSGNDRPFEGIAIKNGEEVNITAKEPGTDKHDGIFKISYKSSAPDVITGSWAPYKNEVTAPKDFNLNRKSFVYSTAVGNYPMASTKLLTEDDLLSYSSYDLYLMRNEIFARHGYCFSRKDTREQFENEDWYVPASTDVRNDLSDIEKKNIKQILKMEKYYNEHGDDFGR